MKGLELSRRYYDAFKDALLAPYGAYRNRIAVGMVGFGSECFGFDDAYSRDHDFGPGFCLWLLDDDYAAIGEALQADYERLPKAFEGVSPREENLRSGRRVGVFPVSGFYAQFLGAPQLPISDADWLQIPEDLLATAVNGAVFEDPCGVFSDVRSRLLAYYPESVQRRKLANAVAKMAQSGQYNLPRSIRRQEMATALLAQAEFVKFACSVVYLLNRRFAPFYKWLHRGIKDVRVLPGLYSKIGLLGQVPPGSTEAFVEDICSDVLNALIAEGYTGAGRRVPGVPCQSHSRNEIVERNSQMTIVDEIVSREWGVFSTR